ncbi:MAG: thioredoxin family protein [Ignavibacteriae bacterium]|nr:thioredoxin family protein [Ignavibacteriota bacterium]
MKRKIEVFTAGCPVCEEQVQKIKNISCPSCEVEVLNVNSDPNAFEKSKVYGIKSIPAVVVDGVLASCCSDRGMDMDVLRAMGLGIPQ